MSAIRHALIKLDNAVSKLENHVSKFEESLEGSQRDMFSAPKLPPAGAANGNQQSLDVKAITKRVDKAIEQVEDLLSKSAQS